MQWGPQYGSTSRHVNQLGIEGLQYRGTSPQDLCLLRKNGRKMRRFSRPGGADRVSPACRARDGFWAAAAGTAGRIAAGGLSGCRAVRRRNPAGRSLTDPDERRVERRRANSRLFELFAVETRYSLQDDSHLPGPRLPWARSRTVGRRRDRPKLSWNGPARVFTPLHRTGSLVPRAAPRNGGQRNDGCPGGMHRVGERVEDASVTLPGSTRTAPAGAGCRGGRPPGRPRRGDRNGPDQASRADARLSCSWVAPLTAGPVRVAAGGPAGPDRSPPPLSKGTRCRVLDAWP
jgi:hypothetical protein